MRAAAQRRTSRLWCAVSTEALDTSVAITLLRSHR